MLHFHFAALLALCTVANAISFQDLYKALDTTEKVWLKQRSYKQQNHHDCVYASKLFLNNTDYKFEQHYKNGEKKIQNELFAKLGGQEEEYPWMIVSKEQGGQGLKYTLKFANENEKCGVLTLHLGGKDECEMHVWDETVDTTLTECKMKYKELCTTSHGVYSSDCEKNSA
ncbi:uncharacterized protein LOC142579946 [Dermacentor variabilis]|uniref:uncharacterized protein LOC142579946 n=1 Tax=Dermacentor variabilis TaxID=34621 RepID=UPI003F5B7FFF